LLENTRNEKSVYGCPREVPHRTTHAHQVNLPSEVKKEAKTDRQAAGFHGSANRDRVLEIREFGPWFWFSLLV
jgi:hypothetical protein